MSSSLQPEGDGATSGGVRGRESSEEFVEVSHPPEEQREEMSPSLAIASLEEDREDLPEEPPLEVPSREDEAAAVLVALLEGSNRLRPNGLADVADVARLGLGGETAEPAPFLKGGEVRTEPSECCTRSRTSLHLRPPTPR